MQAIGGAVETINNATGCHLLPLSAKPARAVVLTKLDTDVDDEPVAVYITMPQLAFKRAPLFRFVVLNVRFV